MIRSIFRVGEGSVGLVTRRFLGRLGQRAFGGVETLLVVAGPKPEFICDAEGVQSRTAAVIS